MSEHKDTSDPPSPRESAVETDTMPTRYLARQLLLVAVSVVLISLGLWRLLLYQSTQEQRRQENAEPSDEALLLRAENEGKLSAPAHLDRRSMHHRMPIDEAVRRVGKSGALVRSQVAPPTGPTTPPVDPSRNRAVTPDGGVAAPPTPPRPALAPPPAMSPAPAMAPAPAMPPRPGRPAPAMAATPQSPPVR
ncbi:MAG: hypothetical protein ABI333_15805 [bacterium]